MGRLLSPLFGHTCLKEELAVMEGAGGYSQPPNALSEQNFIPLKKKKGCSQHLQVPGSVPETGLRTKMCTLPWGQFGHRCYRTS